MQKRSADKVDDLLAAICRDPSLCLRDPRVCVTGAADAHHGLLMDALRDRDRQMPIELGTPVAG